MGDQQGCIRVYEDQDKIQQYVETINEFQPFFGRLAQVMDLAGNENRLKIIYLLREENNLCVCDLSDILAMSIPAVSQHLRKLKDAQLIQARKVGQTVFYSLREESSDILHLILAHLTTLQKSSELAVSLG
ncbi:DNA-binding transcriptional ArsR family regulator [Dyadobacter sp. BE34]|uniref:DNA-binding transcriptional ArsR family regulator n=1 Tax=Dyadobacter fermentans TaxID=94254 RepID=A0ABU1R8I1_9BACT|nr:MULTISPECIES: metalloregulator ArsR/SmtB family transcription factor [Dyadobacter]HEV7381240.1 metalloregulator ArsR/SmtB family transcription factor [Dyadobacter sp.]MDR6809700.1 DNA-binding transcriptional ArsR family regulator [Dyadobacter fermentans]MDR7047478.1 DNA-binding transcriptional ArsR family regulator [Dyadobacter sp. BE242]MDR7201648.1 DNA-binding transcriptional ArsR family regulator [Dyadobacter sp. BE34]MDR7219518.1 DNA-binding transcriptional ArsR family regulator [Dyadob